MWRGSTLLENMKSIFSQAKEFIGVEKSKPVVEGTTFVFVWYEKSKHRVFVDMGATVSAFEIHVYLATGVMPSRQKLVGFEGSCACVRVCKGFLCILSADTRSNLLLACV